MKWATRAGCHIDRVACAWVITRFIDSDAEFVFVNDPDEIPEGATAFDIRGVPLSHHEGRCTFETIVFYYELADPALDQIARANSRTRPLRSRRRTRGVWPALL